MFCMVFCYVLSFGKFSEVDVMLVLEKIVIPLLSNDSVLFLLCCWQNVSWVWSPGMVFGHGSFLYVSIILVFLMYYQYFLAIYF
jgi:hypothetical protein